jgi:hypothetical protein
LRTRIRLSRAAVQAADDEKIVTKRDDLRKKYEAAAALRTKKVDEIRELLAIPPDPSDEKAVEFIAQWLETGRVSVPSKLRSKAQRLLREWQSIHTACVEIRRQLGEAELPSQWWEGNAGLSLVRASRECACHQFIICSTQFGQTLTFD